MSAQGEESLTKEEPFELVCLPGRDEKEIRQREECLRGRESRRTEDFVPGAKLEGSCRPRQMVKGSQGKLKALNLILPVEGSQRQCLSRARLDWTLEGR